MKPIKLTMTAFGPYKDTEVVSFNELEDNRLFVISGKTGAGKTTIFDGICFALYGSASGEDRQDYKMLRSDFADDHVHTSIELIFDIHGKRYRILRQLGHVKDGNKTATGEKYEFYQVVDDREVPCVDRQMVSEINERVEEIVGLTKDQFSQIVMLPQGEFRKLLTSKTENKEEILRRIFQTYPYQDIAERLKEKRRQAEEAFSKIEQQREHYVAEIQSKLPEREGSKLTHVLSQEHFNMNQLVGALEDELEFYQNEIKVKGEEKTKASNYAQTMQDRYQKAKVLNERFEELAKFEKELDLLNSKESVIKEQQVTLEKSERASQLEIYERQVKEQEQDADEKKQAKLKADQALKTAQENFKEADTQYHSEAAKKEEREQATTHLNRLKELRPKVEEISTKKKLVDEAEVNLKQVSSKLSSVEQQITTKRQQVEELDSLIRKETEMVEKLPEKQRELEQLREKWKESNRFIQMIGERDILKDKVQAEEKVYHEAKAEFEQKEQAWLHGQAGVLASHLNDGEPCPVCGSTEHPNKAVLTEETPSKEGMDQAKNHYDQHYQAYTKLVTQYQEKLDQMEEKKQVLAEYDIDDQKINQTFDWLVEQGQQLKNEVEHLDRISKELKPKRDQSENLAKHIKEIELEQENLRKQVEDKKQGYHQAKLTYESLLDAVPVDIRTLQALDGAINQAETKKSKLEFAWEQVQKQWNDASETLTKTKTQAENSHQYLKEAESKLQKVKETFKEQLELSNFANEDDYRTAKRTEEVRKAIKDEIEHYKQQRTTVSSRVQELKEQLSREEKVELSAIEVQLNEAKEQYELALQQYNSTVDHQKNAAELKERILETNKRVSEQEKTLNRIADLYDVVRGQNSQKISFERYLQIEYLEQIVDAANLRLKRLSNGQFYLKRSDRQEARGRQSGLGLDVYDVYTGQNRDVKTLSGGEKFNASLCLALGMSDVIQSFQGGVSIETMFIDEGFGSLDDESLNKAIDTLIDLQKSGRMIGVISHVQELKAAIPAILEVNKSRDGYSETQFVLK
ncbi:AAA family ATPase [Aquisalibacillus elongatus]|uniref:Nuclease SbcCD subunit C n=1 Tax=Aquisalibacillus elongatus TaxID=485577 RepID=A0A3N5B7M3_9BACI|nr:SMC family ATPase [Aquisalibacillus elongatus]RPF53307.1 exonuclease SbcC [Aquisalibacillus elongatus]